MTKYIYAITRFQIPAGLWADLHDLKPVVHARIFVPVEKGIENGRIVGHPGEDYICRLPGVLPGRPAAASGSWIGSGGG